MQKSALISDDGKYRYHLLRRWDSWSADRSDQCVFIMLNPSTADDKEDDPTIRRCIQYAKDWGYGGIDVLNLFAVRATDPKDMKSASDPVGPDSMTHIKKLATQDEIALIVCVWGVHGSYMGQDQTVLGWLEGAGIEPMALKVTKDGHPCHPLYLKGDLKPVPLKELINAN